MGDARPHGAGRGAAAIPAPAFEHVPAVVRALAAAAPREVDLLLGVLAHVPDHEVARLAVEGEAPRVAQPVRPDRLLRARAAGERVALHAVALAVPRVDPQQL